MFPSNTAESASGTSSVAPRAAELLAGYLLAAGHRTCPGTDGLTVAEAVAAFYQTAALAGDVPTAAELAQLHPELACAITALLASREPREVVSA